MQEDGQRTILQCAGPGRPKLLLSAHRACSRSARLLPATPRQAGLSSPSAVCWAGRQARRANGYSLTRSPAFTSHRHAQPAWHRTPNESDHTPPICSWRKRGRPPDSTEKASTMHEQQPSIPPGKEAHALELDPPGWGPCGSVGPQAGHSAPPGFLCNSTFSTVLRREKRWCVKWVAHVSCVAKGCCWGSCVCESMPQAPARPTHWLSVVRCH